MDFRIALTDKELIDLNAILKEAKQKSRQEENTLKILNLIETIDGQVHKQVAEQLIKSQAFGPVEINTTVDWETISELENW